MNGAVGCIKALSLQESTHAKTRGTHRSHRHQRNMLGVAAKTLLYNTSRLHDIDKIMDIDPREVVGDSGVVLFLRQALRASKTRRRNVASSAVVASSIRRGHLSKT